MRRPRLHHLLQPARARRFACAAAQAAEQAGEEIERFQHQRTPPRVVHQRHRPQHVGRGQPPVAQLGGREGPRQGTTGGALDERLDLGPALHDGRLEAADLAVVAADLGKLLVDRLVARQVGQGTAQDLEPARLALPAIAAGPLADARLGMRIDEDQPPVHLAEGAMDPDVADRGEDGLVVEHAAVEQHHFGGVHAARAVVREVARQEALARTPRQPARGQQGVHLGQPGGREGARIGRRGARREGERGRVVETEVAVELAGPAMLAGEAQQVAMLALAQQRRVVGEQRALDAAEVGHRDRQRQAGTRGQQRAGGHRTRLHREQAVEQLRAQQGPVERRAEPARTHEGERALERLGVGLGLEHALAPGPRQQRPQQRAEVPLVPLPGARLRCDQALHVGALQPQPRHRRQAEIVRERARERDAVDGSRRRARDHVDQHAQVHHAPEALEQVEIHLGGPRVGARARRIHMAGRLLGGGPFDAVVGARGAREVEQFAVDAVLVHRERNATEQHQCEPQFLLLHRPLPRARPRAGPRARD